MVIIYVYKDNIIDFTKSTEVTRMTEKETKIAENIRRMIPLLSEQGKERLLAFSEGMAQMAELQHKSERAKEQEAS